MEIRAYQEWLEAWDRARGWDRVSLSHTLAHAMEEFGEVARLVLEWEGYKERRETAAWRADLEEELSDLLVFLFKIANQGGIDLDEALVRGQAKADARHDDLPRAVAEVERYHLRQAKLLAAMREGSNPD